MYSTCLLKCFYLAGAALIESLSFLLKVLTGVTQLRGRVGVSPGLQRTLANANHAERSEVSAECADSP